MTDSAWTYLMAGAYLLGVNDGQYPPEKAIIRATVWRASVLLLWPAVLTLGAVQMWRQRREGR